MKIKKAETEKKAPKQFYCDICDMTLKGGTYKYNRHLYHHKVVPARHECKKCHKTFFGKDDLYLHKKTHMQYETRTRYKCDYCGKDFLHKNTLVAHIIHKHDSLIGDRKKYVCDACGVCYKEHRLLKHHIRLTHFNLSHKEPMHVKKKLNETWVERVMDTEVCVLMTKINNNVIMIKKCDKIKEKSEKNSQTNVRGPLSNEYLNLVVSNTYYSKAICDYCKKEMWKKSLVNHIRERHLKIKKFHCKSCQRRFNRRYQLMQHICGKTFRMKRLIKH